MSGGQLQFNPMSIQIWCQSARSSTSLQTNLFTLTLFEQLHCQWWTMWAHHVQHSNHHCECVRSYNGRRNNHLTKNKTLANQETNTTPHRYTSCWRLLNNPWPASSTRNFYTSGITNWIQYADITHGDHSLPHCGHCPQAAQSTSMNSPLISCPKRIQIICNTKRLISAT